MAKKVSAKSDITPDEKTFGVILIAFGKSAYIYMAYNLAMSIKFYSPDVKVCLHVADENLFKVSLSPDKQKVFDEVHGFHYKGNPAEVKLNIDGFCVYDRSLYLDVDTFAIKDIAPLFDELNGNEYLVHNNNADNLWAKPETIYKHYGLENIPLYSVNSSVQYIEKGETSFKIFEKARELYANPVPLNQLKNSWGKQQPDELYMNVALSILKHDPSFEMVPVFFATRPSLVPHKIQDEYYFLSYFGPRGHTPASYTNWIDSRLNTMHQERGTKHTNNCFIGNLLRDKHANRK